jgi:hypothetical protein
VVGRASAADLVALRCRARYQVAKWARLFTRLRRPVHAIFLSGLADNALCVGAAIEKGALLDGKTLVSEVAFDMGI